MHVALSHEAQTGLHWMPLDAAIGQLLAQCIALVAAWATINKQQ